jgi:peptidoglycan/LPS O-acetylase OafA/YrhL
LASLAVAYVSYEFFEKRFLRLKRLFGRAEKQAPQSPRGLGVQPSVSRSGWSSKQKRPGLASTGDMQSAAFASTVEQAGQ